MLVDKAPTKLGSAVASLGEDLRINGTITSKGEVHLSGQVYGDVHCHKLLVGEEAEIQGNVVAEEVVIRGRVVGNVRASGVVLQSSCCVEGDVSCQTLIVEKGATFDGESRIDKGPPKL